MKVVKAQYPGTCPVCREPYRKGTRLLRSEPLNQWAHSYCALQDFKIQRARASGNTIRPHGTTAASDRRAQAVTLRYAGPN